MLAFFVFEGRQLDEREVRQMIRLLIGSLVLLSLNCQAVAPVMSRRLFIALVPVAGFFSDGHDVVPVRALPQRCASRMPPPDLPDGGKRWDADIELGAAPASHIPLPPACCRARAFLDACRVWFWIAATSAVVSNGGNASSEAKARNASRRECPWPIQ